MIGVGELRLQVRLVGTAHAGAARVEVLAALLAEFHVARLGHEFIDHPVEDDAVIGALASQFLDPSDVAGRQIGIKLDRHIALGRRHENRVFRILDLGHWSSFPLIL